MIRGPIQLRDAYRDSGVARRYIDERFREPLGALLHRRQVDALKGVLRRHRPRQVLEIAPGPARLTAELAPLLRTPITLMDTSLEMLGEARRRVAQVARAPGRFIQGDVFGLPFRAAFDLVYAFRLIRHFEAADRERIYRELARALRPGGLLVFDAVNEAVSAPLRARARPGEYAHYDALARPDVLRAELANAGLDIVGLDGVQHRYPVLARLQVLLAPRSRTLARAAMELVDRIGGEPLEWIVTCRRA